ncbi:MAG TPA: OpcA/G6PD domain-containing protein [Terriglobales bacterium]|nr:OpcA/G6PD domain-containing protein [Terriglobales bacterium]
MQLDWQELAPNGALETSWAALRKRQGEDHARALAFNLICRAADAADAAVIAAGLGRLGTLHPARVFLLVPGEASGGGPRLRIAAQPRGSEMAELTLPAERAASWVAPHLAADLPIILLWRAGRPGADAALQREFDAWTTLADRLLVDAHRMGMTPAQLAELGRAVHGRAHLSDLTWARLTPWRQLLCQGLETSPGAFRHIAHVSITAGHEPQPGASLAATLLAGWMARQLDWAPQGRVGPDLLRLRAGGGASEVMLALRSCPRREKHGLLRQVQVTAQDPAAAAPGLQLAIHHSGSRFELEVRGPRGPLGRWSGGQYGVARSEVDTLCEEFSLHHPDLLYQPALERGVEIMSRLEISAA